MKVFIAPANTISIIKFDILRCMLTGGIALFFNMKNYHTMPLAVKTKEFLTTQDQCILPPTTEGTIFSEAPTGLVSAVFFVFVLFCFLYILLFFYLSYIANHQL